MRFNGYHCSLRFYRIRPAPVFGHLFEYGDFKVEPGFGMDDNFVILLYHIPQCVPAGGHQVTILFRINGSKPEGDIHRLVRQTPCLVHVECFPEFVTVTDRQLPGEFVGGTVAIGTFYFDGSECGCPDIPVSMHGVSGMAILA